MKYFSYSNECGMVFHATAKEAKANAQDALDYEEGGASEGWDTEELGTIVWGKISQRVEAVVKVRREDMTEDHLSKCGITEPSEFEFDFYAEFELRAAK